VTLSCRKVEKTKSRNQGTKRWGPKTCAYYVYTQRHWRNFTKQKKTKRWLTKPRIVRENVYLYIAQQRRAGEGGEFDGEESQGPKGPSHHALPGIRTSSEQRERSRRKKRCFARQFRKPGEWEREKRRELTERTPRQGIGARRKGPAHGKGISPLLRLPHRDRGLFRRLRHKGIVEEYRNGGRRPL